MMMMKSFIFQNQQQQQQQEENMSNLTTSASGTEASVSSSGTNTNRDHNYGHHPPPDIPSSAHPPAKKKRNMPGNPDPDSEVISLSPKTLMATNRFLCEICNKGFQRDQNLQLHRRGHNLPWKLKQRNKDEVVRRKVYVCPEPSCVHHDPSRALGDLTGIKKHFSRKHGEKKWKCDKCSKKYAVQSDWKAHSKTCGTREYRCDCGTLFSRRDSFITHRAFCDALAEESARAIPPNNTMSAPPPPPSPLMNLQPAVPQFNSSNVMNHHPTQEDNSNSHMNLQYPFSPSLKKEHQQQQHQPCYNSQSGGNFGMLMNNIRAAQQPGSAELPPWLASCPSSGLLLGTRGPPHHPSSSPSSSSPSILSASTAAAGAGGGGGTSPNPSQMGPTTLTLPNFQTAAAAGAPHMSATALLQKAAQMGSSSSSTNTTKTAGLHTGPHHNHVSNNNNLGFNFSSSRPPVHQQQIGGGNFFQEMMNYSGGGGFEEDEDGMASFEDAFGGGSKSAAAAALGDGTGGSEGMTRDFLGLRPLSHSDLLSLAGFGHCINDDVPPPDQQQQQQQQQHNSHNHESLKPWQGN
ncbi:Protein indeterminate-domain 7 [Linum perenne]